MPDSEAARSGSLDPTTLDFAELVSGFAAYLGLELTEVSPDGVAGRWSAEPRLWAAEGVTHRGAHSSVIETLASVAAAVWLGDRGQVVGVNNNTDFLDPESPGPFVSTATPVHRGEDYQLWLVETVDDSNSTVVRGQVRLQNLRARS